MTSVRPASRRAAFPTTGPTDSFTDVPGFRVGHWTNSEAATGCTVILAQDPGAVAACSVLGGAPGTRETDLLRPGNTVERMQAVLLTGGSAFGLDAAAGVVRFLEERGSGFRTRHAAVPIVVAAVLYDLGVGRPSVRPDADAGYAACVAASTAPPATGSVGAGTGATVAKIAGLARAIKGGIGSASERLGDGTIVAAIAAVNALGDIYDRSQGRWLARPRADGYEARVGALDVLRLPRRHRRTPEFTNTTLVAVATSASLTRDQLQRVAEMAQGGIARAIEPSHSPGDGDAVFALSLGGPVRRSREPDVIAIGALGAHAVSRAIVRAVENATGLGGVPSVNDIASHGASAPR